MDYNIDQLEWKCPDCGVTAAPTNYDYMKLLKHQKGHHIELVNKVTGEVHGQEPKTGAYQGYRASWDEARWIWLSID